MHFMGSCSHPSNCIYPAKPGWCFECDWEWLCACVIEMPSLLDMVGMSQLVCSNMPAASGADPVCGAWHIGKLA